MARKDAAKYIFIAALAIIFGFQGYWTWQQYRLWHDNGPPGIYFLPPYQKINFFILYSYVQFFSSYVISFAASLVFLLAARVLNWRFQKRFFEEEEPYWGAMSIFVLGQPLWLYYVPLVLGTGFAVTGYNLLIRRKRDRFSLYHFWRPAGILILAGFYLLGGHPAVWYAGYAGIRPF